MNAFALPAVNPLVLLVEDSPGDVLLTQEAFRGVNARVCLDVVTDGIQAIDYLHRMKPAGGAPWPDIILLDLNLPGMDGSEVLARIKADDALKVIPTIILSTSSAEADIVRSYKLQANCYLSKPLRFDDFEALVQSINDFWLTRARLPISEPSA
jgi:CheY-like chemotaxis protein